MVDEKVIIPEWLNAKKRKIEDHVKGADTELLEAAKILVEIKDSFDKGVFTKLKWRVWSTEELSLGPRRIRELLRMGRAANPAAELAQQRAANTARQQRHRAAQTESTRPAPRLKSPTAISEADRCRPETSGPEESRLQDFGLESVEPSAEAKRLIEWAAEASLDQIKRVLSFIAELESARAQARTRS